MMIFANYRARGFMLALLGLLLVGSLYALEHQPFGEANTAVVFGAIGVMGWLCGRLSADSFGSLALLFGAAALWWWFPNF